MFWNAELSVKQGLAACIWIAAYVGACNTGLVSIGDDHALECERLGCGDLPSESPVCSDMTMGLYECERGMNDECAWVLSCPASLPCSPAACGDAPMQTPMCMNGVWGWGYACEPDEMQCSWQGVCPEAARECSPTECEPTPSVVAECMGGPAEGASCLSDASGNCRWTAVVCRSSP